MEDYSENLDDFKSAHERGVVLRCDLGLLRFLF